MSRMKKYLETELKLRMLGPSKTGRVHPEIFLAKGYHWGLYKEAELDNTYYDTEDKRFLRKHIMLRVRDTGEEKIATVKVGGPAAGGLHIRQEWNRPLESGGSFPEAFSDLPIGKRLKILTEDEPLEELLKTRFRRVSRVLTDERGSVVELSVDEGEILAGDKSRRLWEIELELMEGEAVSLIELGKALAERFPLMFENQSKFERGLILAGIQSRKPEDRPATADGDRPAKEALEEILIKKLQEIIARQESFLREPGDPETAHALRVRIRQTRALLSFSKPLLDGPSYDALQEKLRALANRLSALREIDVMLEKWIPIYKEQPGVIQNQSRLTEILREKRRGEEEQAVRYFSSGASTPVLLEIWAGILDMRWDEKADCPIGDFEKKRIGEWSSKFLGGLESQDFSEMRATHALRILGKKIRYARSEVLPERDDGPRSDPEKLKLLQTLLGELCDAGRNIEILKELMEERKDPQLTFESGVLVGYQLREAETLITAIRNTVKKAGRAD